MIFVNPTFFEFEPVKIANISENGDVRQDVARFIGIYEKHCLIEVLGECLYNELMSSYEFVNGAYVLKENATEPIKRLVNGFVYDAPINTCDCGCGGRNCDKRYWGGFVVINEYLTGSAIGQIKTSFIADYIYYHYLLVNRSITTSTGQQVLSGENSLTVQNISKRIDSYNDYVLKVRNLYQFIKDNIVDYPTWERNCYITYKTKF